MEFLDPVVRNFHLELVLHILSLEVLHALKEIRQDREGHGHDSAAETRVAINLADCSFEVKVVVAAQTRGTGHSLIRIS